MEPTHFERTTRGARALPVVDRALRHATLLPTRARLRTRPASEALTRRSPPRLTFSSRG